MNRPLLFLASTASLIVSMLFSQAVTAQSIRMRPVKIEQKALKSSNQVESGASVLGIHEVDLRSLRPSPVLPATSEQFGIKKTSDVRLAPVFRGSGIASPAEEDEGLQIKVTPAD
jgi:hypothetical protein